MPKLSICIPAFKAEKYLAETLVSVRNQTFQDWELIITEDGSKDSTEAIVGKFAREVPQPVRYLRHETNQGLSASRNSCIRAANSPLIALLDADDLWDPNHLESGLKTFADSGADIVHAGSILFDQTGELEIRAPKPSQVEHLLDCLYRLQYIIQPSSALILASVFDRIGYFDPAAGSTDDLDFWLRAVTAGCQIRYTGLNSCRYRKHPGALTASGAAMTASLAAVYLKHLDCPAIPLALRQTTTAQTLKHAGRMYLRQDPAKAAGFFLKAWKVRPARLDYLAWTVLAHSMATLYPSKPNS